MDGIRTRYGSTVLIPSEQGNVSNIITASADTFSVVLIPSEQGNVSNKKL